jgi:hypothetical protein
MNSYRVRRQGRLSIGHAVANYLDMLEADTLSRLEVVAVIPVISRPFGSGAEREVTEVDVIVRPK